MDSIIQQSFLDLMQDGDELKTLVLQQKQRLTVLAAFFVKHPDFLRSTTRGFIFEEVERLLGVYDTLQKSLEVLSERVAKASHDELAELCEERTMSQDLFRTAQGMTGALLVSVDWESPSFLHSIYPQSGKQEGKINGTYNDYKRDQHLDAESFESQFARQYVDAGLGRSVLPLVTSSGMAAFTTILFHLQNTRRVEGPILVGENSYFENKKMIARAFRERVHLINECDVDGILKFVVEKQPGAIFLDSLCNTMHVAVTPLARLMPLLAKTMKKSTYVVIDNSGFGPSYQPWKDLPRLSSLHMIVFESLNKYYQFGMDRVTGGVMYAMGGDKNSLFSARIHLGTNIPDASACTLPLPNRTLLDRRMARISRNTARVAAALDTFISEKRPMPLASIVYPGLPSHPAYSWVKDKPFQGGCFVLVFQPLFQNVLAYDRFVNCVISEAKRAQVNILSGTSFGFNTTRIYLTARHASRHAQQFLRVSVGTESVWEIEQLIEVFKRATERFLGIG